MRYFVLNSLFFYTTSTAYIAMCATIEYIGVYLDPNATLPTSIGICTTSGLLIMLSLLLIYFLLDRFIYENEFWSIWTPYLFVAYAFICPPLRQLSFIETDIVSDNRNYYLLWALFSTTILVICTRLYRRVSLRYRRTMKKTRINSYFSAINSRLQDNS